MKKILKMGFALTIAASLVACGNNSKDNKEMSLEAKDGMNISKDTNIPTSDVDTNAQKSKALPKLDLTDQDGKKFTNEDFKKYDATVINLWFTGCSACIDEMPELNKLSDDIKKDSKVNFVSLCTDKGYDESTKEAYARIIKDNKVSYQALGVDDINGDMKSYTDTVFAYPTTIVVDKNGNIIGNDVVGTLTTDEQIGKLKANIDLAKQSSQK